MKEIKIRNIPEPFHSAVLKVKQLEKFDEYLGAFIFGSVARGEQNSDSDLDIKVVTAREEYCDTVNHPYIGEIKLDLSFNSKKRIKDLANEEMGSRKRVPMVAESIIIFDKDGFIKNLKSKALKVKPKKLRKKDHHWSKFMIYHAHDKAYRYLENDPASAMFSMGIDINDVLKDHYKLHGQWWVSNKRMLQDLESWDPHLARLLRKFSLSVDVGTKYKNYLKILNYISLPMGDWQNLKENNCNCKLCKKDLSYLE